ncbi:MAG: molybdopterin molybdotransferase MoeA [Caulobacterales bacterium]|nr:molybdopterin molybdotransferase MoeA [Caulobacterales bacterium]
MISVSEARALMLDAAQPVATERVSLRAARGRTLREDIVATRAQPPFRASAMDGYALRAADTPGVLRMIGETSAGRALDRTLGLGECARIFTGAPLPEGADSVLIQEDAIRAGDSVTSPAIRAGRHVRAAGVDFEIGDSLLRSGRVLDAAAIALAATAGRASLQVARAPKVAVLSGGNEIVPPGTSPAPDQIFDSMSYGVAALAETWGAGASTGFPFKDDAQTIAATVAQSIETHDLTIIVGGASVGDHDHARPALRALGGEFLFEKIALRPGKPTWFARVGERLILGLPGNPASALVCARLFLRPLLDKLCGRDPAAAMRTIGARARTPLAENGARETYLRAHVESDANGQLWARAPHNQDSSLISVFAGANALIVRAPDAPETAESALIDVLYL